MDNEKLDKEMIEGMVAIRDLAEKSIKELSRTRALMLKTGAKEEDVTRFINEVGKHYGEMYDKMSLKQLLMDMAGDLLKALANKEE